MNNIIVHVNGFVDDDGRIAIPGVYLEDGAKVELSIKVVPGKFEVALFPSEENDSSGANSTDCGISDEEINKCCAAHADCDECPLNEYCMEELNE